MQLNINPPKPYIIGLTGGSGTGTTSVGQILRRLGAAFVNCDEVYHRLLSDDEGLKSAIAGRFGREVISDGKIDRRRLAAIVFDDKKALSDLETITHPAVIAETARLVGGCGREVCVIEAVRLIESGVAASCGTVWAVVAPKKLRIERITARDGITGAEAQRRIEAQPPDEYYMKNCAVIIRNDGNLKDLENTVEKLYSATIGEKQGK